jgi:chromosome segregation ATPase
MAVLVERRLRQVSRRLSSLREELAVADEQLAHFADLTDDSRIRAMVSETPLADEDHRQAERTSAAMARHRAELVESIARLEAEQDDLLDQLSRKRRG